jgi:hypothetical protein
MRINLPTSRKARIAQLASILEEREKLDLAASVSEIRARIILKILVVNVDNYIANRRQELADLEYGLRNSLGEYN